MATYSLSGSGTHALTASTTGLQVTITTPSVVQGVGRANPANHYHTGMIRFSDGVAYWDPVPITGGPQFIPVPQNATSIGYAMQGGAVVSVVEVIGGTVFFSGGGSGSLSGLTDVMLASPADGEVLQWNASAAKWENATPAATSAIGTHSDLGADVSMVSAGPWYDGPAITVDAGVWLLAGIIAIQCGGPTTVSYRVSDGTNVSASVAFNTNGTALTDQAFSFVLKTIGSTTFTIQGTTTWTGCSIKAHNTSAWPVAGSFIDAVKLA